MTIAAVPKISRQDVVEAAARIEGQVERTPLIPSAIGFLKCECLQTGGSFKLRGATNRLLQLTDVQRQRGVVAFSSGNHAQGVAIAAQRLGIPATIVMPADAPAIKVEGTRRAGAEIIFYDRLAESREAIAARLAEERGLVVVPSFDDVMIVAGQGSVGVELLEQMPVPPSRIVVPCGGGGLASGIAIACPDAEVIAVEPAGWDDMRRSLEAGEIVPVGPNPPPTLCDALQTLRVSPITYDALANHGAKVLAVSEAQVRDAVRWAWREHGLKVEPGGAVALASVLAGLVAGGSLTAIVLSGGNVDPALHAELVA